MYICSCRVNIVFFCQEEHEAIGAGLDSCVLLTLIHSLFNLEILKFHINIVRLAVVRLVMLCFFCVVAVRFHINSVWVLNYDQFVLPFIVVLLTFYSSLGVGFRYSLHLVTFAVFVWPYGLVVLN